MFQIPTKAQYCLFTNGSQGLRSLAHRGGFVKICEGLLDGSVG